MFFCQDGDLTVKKSHSSLFLCSSSEGRVQDRVTAKPEVRPGAEWDRAASPRVHSDPSGGVLLQSYLSMDHEQRQLRATGGFQSIVEPQKTPEPGTESETTLSPSPAHSLDADLDVPMETDIDDFQEHEDGPPAKDGPITSELPCFALPVTVLETDIDTEASPPGSLEGEGLEEELEEEEELRAGEAERLSLEELFPQSCEGEPGRESWRGAYRTTEHNADSLDR